MKSKINNGMKINNVKDMGAFTLYRNQKALFWNAHRQIQNERNKSKNKDKKKPNLQLNSLNKNNNMITNRAVVELK